MGKSEAEDRAEWLVIEVDVLISGAGPVGALPCLFPGFSW